MAMKGSRPLAVDEVKLIEKSFGGRCALRNKAMFLLGVKTGFRISELLSIRVGDWRQYGKMLDRVTVRRETTRGKIEGHSQRLHPEAQAAFAFWLQPLDQRLGHPLDDEMLVLVSWVHRKDGSYRAISREQAWRWLREAEQANELGGKLGTHCMRKTLADRTDDFARKRQAAGEAIDPLRVVQRVLGHKNINSTMSYLSLRQELVDETVLAA
jgi:integrase